MRVAPLASLALGACISFADGGVPVTMHGETPVYIINWTRQPICGFGLAPGDKRDTRNWLLDGREIDHDVPVIHHVKNGDYTLWVDACDQSYSVDQQLHVDGPVAIVIGDPESPPPTEYSVVQPELVRK